MLGSLKPHMPTQNAQTQQIVPVILSGGSGTRLWPKSRKAYPKQLHRLYGEFTMLQHTVKRVSQYEAPIVVCNDDQRFMVADQLTEVCNSKAHILLEPAARNTAPAIAAAAHYALQQYENPILVVLAADHLIKNINAFHTALEHAINAAQQNKLVAFGVVPSKPETGYGYIQAQGTSGPDGCAIAQFVEKPNLETAEQYLAAGNYTWNSGMFVFGAKKFLEELAASGGAWINHCTQSVEKADKDLDFVRLEQKNFAACESISVDYAVMEKTNKAWVVPLDAGWSDLGSWESLWEASEKDDNGNAILGDAFVKNCKNSLIHSQEKLVAAIGLNNVAIIESDDAVLVVNRETTQDVKHVVDWLKTQNRTEFLHHRQVHRPWGAFDSLGMGSRYQVKRIEVKPGASISLQMHHHRAEHWIVVEGTALVQKGEEEVLLTENESIYIPLGQKHRLHNPGKVTLQLIEVQSGSYLGEDDIVRFSDSYGRVEQVAPAEMQTKNELKD
ncbi:mannose-1-phosphate guanylyltransferase/mannose-6-phosphate isomerase [Teredinibacter franksiae]|uniref:mannose-1-phosphate guanylyltransferase/mannose-6-phosphate isomerase n=1 Tax=Teredinibacter franksiae TaxID=2761453 RepID=UPI001FE58677|nr:mannose-1-phosphate guanylyltransferase/mannose-6-phosphate isomerase [Teredinibacter franksiae]